MKRTVSHAAAAIAAAIAMMCSACGGASASASAAGGAGSREVKPIAQANIELAPGHTAIVAGQRLAFDGVAEAFAWPALATAVTRSETVPSPIVILVPRDTPMTDLLRVVWTLRTHDLQIETPDAKGALRALDFRARPQAHSPGCHLAVFVREDGSLRIAAPGGAREIRGELPNEQLARALDSARASCPIRYVAFGSESHEATWGAVFDTAFAVDRDRSAGDARYVLAEPITH